MMLIISNKNFFIKNLGYKRTVICVFFLNSYYFVNFIKIQEFFDGAAPAQ